MTNKYYLNENKVLLSIDSYNNYSVALQDDPFWEDEGYVGHRWGEDADEWTEITEEEACNLLYMWQDNIEKLTSLRTISIFWKGSSDNLFQYIPSCLDCTILTCGQNGMEVIGREDRIQKLFDAVIANPEYLESDGPEEAIIEDINAVRDHEPHWRNEPDEAIIDFLLK